MKRSRISWDALLVVSIVMVAGLCAQSQQVVLAEDDAQPEGRIVRISPDADDDASVELPLEGHATVGEASSHWIGISGRAVESPVLRTHLQLAEDMGVVIERVVPESPADKAGLRKHDIILRVNGAGVHGMEVLQDHVRTHQAKPLELKLIRLGKEETMVVVPEERPEGAAGPVTEPGLRGWNARDGQRDVLGRLMEQFQREGGLQRGMRMIGPGIFLHGQQFNMNELPNGVSVSVQRENDGPAKITVKQGDKTWQIVGDDPESLEQLPENLRPFVQRMFNGSADQQGAMAFDWEGQLEDLLPRGLGGLERGFGQLPALEPDPQETELKERLERMEQELRDLQKRLSEE